MTKKHNIPEGFRCVSSEDLPYKAYDCVVCALDKGNYDNLCERVACYGVVFTEDTPEGETRLAVAVAKVVMGIEAVSSSMKVCYDRGWPKR